MTSADNPSAGEACAVNSSELSHAVRETLRQIDGRTLKGYVANGNSRLDKHEVPIEQTQET